MTVRTSTPISFDKQKKCHLSAVDVRERTFWLWRGVSSHCWHHYDQSLAVGFHHLNNSNNNSLSAFYLCLLLYQMSHVAAPSMTPSVLLWIQHVGAPQAVKSHKQGAWQNSSLILFHVASLGQTHSTPLCSLQGGRRRCIYQKQMRAAQKFSRISHNRITISVIIQESIEAEDQLEGHF